MEALKSGKSIEKVLMMKGLKSEGAYELLRLLNNSGINRQTVPVQKLNSLINANHQGVIALCSPIHFTNIETLLPGIYERGEIPLILILDSITDVRNFGAIVRTAECSGVHAIIIPDRGSARVGSDAVKTSAGALLEVPICRSRDLITSIKYLKDSGLKIIACTEKTGNNIGSSTEMKEPLAIVLGAEDEGIDSSLLKLCDIRVKIPLLGNIQSLNVSVACGIITYEVLRQRGIWG